MIVADLNLCKTLIKGCTFREAQQLVRQDLGRLRESRQFTHYSKPVLDVPAQVVCDVVLDILLSVAHSLLHGLPVQRELLVGDVLLLVASRLHGQRQVLVLVSAPACRQLT